MRGFRGRLGLLILATAGVAATATPAVAASPLSITVGPTRLEFIEEAISSELEVVVVLSGGEAGTLTLSMSDAVIDPQGGWGKAPYGSGPNSLEGILTIVPAMFDYVPTETPQSFTATVSVDPSFVDRPRFGSLAAVVVPLEDDATQEFTVRAQAAVEVQVLAAPSAAEIADLPAAEAALTLDTLRFFQIEPWTPVDRVFPDLPWVVNHGPAALEARGSNVGDLLLDTRVTYSFFRLSPLALVAGDGGRQPVFTLGNRPRYVLPGATFVDTTTSLIPVDGAPSVDSLPFIGFVRVSATVEGSLVGLEAEPVTISRTFLVFPWKEATFLFLVWLFQREWKHRKGRKAKLDEEGRPIVSTRTRIRERLGRLLSRGNPEG